jgi:heme/copper-type cytochrome/quinol oxidase subunit 2
MNAQLAPRDSTVSLGDWIITLIVLAIPIVGLIMLFVWGFSGDSNPSKRNYCRAVLIFWLIALVLFILFMVLFGAAMMSAMHGINGATM